MKQAIHTIDINASAERVWQEIIDFDSYASWNPVYKRFVCEARVGGEVEMEIRPNNMTFQSTVIEATPSQKLFWQGGMPLGMFTFTGGFEIETLAPDQARLTFSETLTGWMVPLFGIGMEELNPVRDDMLEKLKQRIA